jgi:hypothetical protein
METIEIEDFTAYEAARNGGPVAAEEPTTPTSSSAAEPEAVPAKIEPNSESGEAKQVGEESEQAKEKKKGGYQRRIDRLTEERAQLAAEVERLKGGTAGGDAGGKPEEPKARPAVENFDTYDEYVEALTDWQAERKLSARITEERERVEKAAAETAERAKYTQFADRAKVAAEKYPDFEAVAYSDEVPVSATMRECILSSDVGAELAYYLGKNPAEAERIAGLEGLAAARAMGRIEARIEAEAAGKPTAEKQKPKLPGAPAPITPLAPSSRKDFNILDEETAGDFAAWEKQRLKTYKG